MDRPVSPQRLLQHPVVLSPKLTEGPHILNTLQLKRDSITPTIERSVSQFIRHHSIDEIKGIKELLINLHKSSVLNSEIHYQCYKHYEQLNTKANIGLLSISLFASILSPILERYDHESNQLFSTVSLAMIGGLGVILNRLGYQTRIEKHRQVHESFVEIIDLIEIAMAYANEEGAGSSTYDMTHVLNEVRQIRHNLNKFAPPASNHIVERVIQQKTIGVPS